MPIQTNKEYKSVLSVHETQLAIAVVKKMFEEKLSKALNLTRVSAPLFVDASTGLNDNLNGVERPVSFDIPSCGRSAEIVHSLAKWKRVALLKYGFPPGTGLYTDMNAIRRDEVVDNIHSVYVDQWDWERIINPGERNIDFLKYAVQLIADALCATNLAVIKRFPVLKGRIKRKVTFVTSQELEDQYPALAPAKREEVFARKYRTVFVTQIGGKLKSGVRHDGRAPDYDDWALNGDLLVWNDALGRAFELSSMGIRVDPESLSRQLEISGNADRLSLDYHKMLMAGALPQTIGGGIGQSRVCMLLLQKMHIGEVQVSLWDEETLTESKKSGIYLL